MIVRRSIHPLKAGKMEEAVALLKELDPKGATFRIYTSEIGPSFGTLALEIEYENLAAFEKAIAEFGASPEGVAFFEKWFQVTEQFSGRMEIWTLQE